MLEFHYTYLFIAFSFIITGHIKDLLVFTSIIIFHELGHYLMARINKVKVKKIQENSAKEAEDSCQNNEIMVE